MQDAPTPYNVNNNTIFLDRVNPNCAPDTFATDHFAKLLEAAGWKVVRSAEEADTIAVLSCYLDLEAQRRTKQALERWKGSGKRIILSGCISLMNATAAQELAVESGAEVIDMPREAIPVEPNSFINLSSFNTDTRYHLEAIQWQRLSDALTQAKSLGLPMPYLQSYVRWGYVYSPNTALVKVAKGCLSNCAYCADRKIRGSLKSCDIEEILYVISDALASGKRDIALVADDLSAHGKDAGSSFSALLTAILPRLGKGRLFLDNCNPRWLLQDCKELLPLVSDKRIVYMTVPIQSINDSLLTHMRRRYSAESALELIARFKSANPELVICTHVIVGFPGETDEQFNELYCWASDGSVDIVEAFDYQEHPDTDAATMPGAVCATIRSERKRMLDELIWDRIRLDLKKLPYINEERLTDLTSLH